MNITEVKIKLVQANDNKLLGYASVALDDQIVIRDIRIINGNNGVFVAMPNRKLAFRCPRCNRKNSFSMNYCSECGARLNFTPTVKLENQSFYTDIVHPINEQAREMLHQEIMKAYKHELSCQSKAHSQYVESAY